MWCFTCGSAQTRSSPLFARGPNFSGTVGELVDVLVEFVFPSVSGVTYLSNPRLMTTHETVFSVCKELILISMPHLPSCTVTCTASSGPMTVLPFVVPIGLFPSLVLVYSLQIVVTSLPESFSSVARIQCVRPLEYRMSARLELSNDLLCD